MFLIRLTSSPCRCTGSGHLSVAASCLAPKSHSVPWHVSRLPCSLCCIHMPVVHDVNPPGLWTRRVPAPCGDLNMYRRRLSLYQSLKSLNSKIAISLGLGFRYQCVSIPNSLSLGYICPSQHEVALPCRRPGSDEPLLLSIDDDRDFPIILVTSPLRSPSQAYGFVPCHPVGTTPTLNYHRRARVISGSQAILSGVSVFPDFTDNAGLSFGDFGAQIGFAPLIVSRVAGIEAGRWSSQSKFTVAAC